MNGQNTHSTGINNDGFLFNTNSTNLLLKQVQKLDTFTLDTKNLNDINKSIADCATLQASLQSLSNTLSANVRAGTYKTDGTEGTKEPETL